MRRAVTFLLLLLLALTTACGGDAPAPTVAPTASPAAPAPTSAPTPAPTETPSPTPESAPTEPPASAAPAPTETPDWEAMGAKLYDGKCKGYGGYVHVTVVLDASGNILDVIMGRHSESEGYGNLAIDIIPAKIVETQSLGLDAVTGATMTSEAILTAVANAITEAGLDPADYGFAP